MCILGTRPEVIKMAPVIYELKKHSEWFSVKVVTTGQHRELLNQALSHFNIEPDTNFDLMVKNQSLSTFTSKALKELDVMFTNNRPDFVLIQGDTQTALSGAMAAFLHKIPIGHVEAGLRTFNNDSPWPEEMNRTLIDKMANLMFAPTLSSRENLQKEGCRLEQIFISGQTAIDAAIFTFQPQYRFKNTILKGLDFNRNKILTVTMHRRENYGGPMEYICAAILRIVANHPDVLILFPLHLNPKVREYIYKKLTGNKRILLLESVEYPDMINLLARSALIISDSGGLQEEAVHFQVPLVITRKTTERPEILAAGLGYLAGSDNQLIYNLARKLLARKDNGDNNFMNAPNVFGDGAASIRIAYVIAHYFRFISELPEEYTYKNKWGVTI